jgi:hypothetical protein
MGANTTFSIDQVTLDTAVPTELPLPACFTWVIWQFPRKQGGGLLGAVRPPTAGTAGSRPLFITKIKRCWYMGRWNGRLTAPKRPSITSTKNKQLQAATRPALCNCYKKTYG